MKTRYYCDQAGQVIGELDELVEIGFRGREASRVEEMINQLGSIEGETDRLESSLIQELFRIEDSLPPVTVMLWYDLIGRIGNLADHAEKVGNRVRLFIAS